MTTAPHDRLDAVLRQCAPCETVGSAVVSGTVVNSGTSTSRVLPVRAAKLHVPDLDELGAAIEKQLRTNFAEATVSVVECPDLRKWGLAAPGLCGSARIADVGGVPYMMDPRYHHVRFNLGDVAQACNLPSYTDQPCYIIGAAAASPYIVGQNAELMCTSVLGKARETHYAEVDEDGKCKCGPYEADECGCLANLYLSEGRPGRVLRVEAARRTGKDNFVSCMRKGMLRHPQVKGASQVGLGGAIKIPSGKVKAHVMPDFKKNPMEDGSPEVSEWLRFYEMGPDLTCLSTIVSGDPSPGGELDLRLEHTHFFRQSGPREGGHYHHDTTPETIRYIGYFAPAEAIYRVQNARVYSNV